MTDNATTSTPGTTTATTTPTDSGPLTPGWVWLGGSAVFYLVCLAVATWPSLGYLTTDLPTRIDPLAHLWTMRWTKACLLAGRLPFFCPGIQYPIGAALGTLPPMHFQTLLYIPLSSVCPNDVLCYNLIRLSSLLLTGLGTLVLAWNVTRQRAVATLGGLLAMLSQPLIFFSQGELEQITVGWWPLFLVAWVRWVDRPSGRGLLAAAVLYLLVAMSAPYFGVFATFPASLYVAWRWGVTWRAGGGGWSWLWRRLGWFLAFGALTAPGMVTLFAGQIWAVRHGYNLTRPDYEFGLYRAPLAGYLLPSPFHNLSRVLPWETNVMGQVGSVPSYLGVVTLGLIAYAALARVAIPRRGFWWLMLALLVVLSLGGHTRIGSWDMPLPAAWLKRHFIGFRMIRVPARFNLFAAVGAAVVASAGLADLLRRLRSARGRALLVTALTLLAVADLRWVDFPHTPVPPLPPCYAAIRQADPSAAIADIPHFNNGAFHLTSLATYWQSLHGGPTSIGYTAFNNIRQDDLLSFTSPFNAFLMAQPDYLRYSHRERVELQAEVDFRSYVWLYLTTHRLRFVVFHHAPGAFPERPIDPRRLEFLLHDSLIWDDPATAVFDRDRMPPPTEPTLVYAEGWGHRVDRNETPTVMVSREARATVYNPDPDRPLILTLDASGHRVDRRVEVRLDGQPVAAWTVPAGPASTPLATPPLRIPAGLHELTLSSDGDARPSRYGPRVPGDLAPFALWVTGIALEPADPVALVGRQIADRITR